MRVKASDWPDIIDEDPPPEEDAGDEATERTAGSGLIDEDPRGADHLLDEDIAERIADLDLVAIPIGSSLNSAKRIFVKAALERHKQKPGASLASFARQLQVSRRVLYTWIREWKLDHVVGAMPTRSTKKKETK